MNGFRDNLYNVDFETAFYEDAIEHLKECSAEMKADCVKTGDFLYNHEDKISNRLVAKYLNKNPYLVRFVLQSPEKFLSSDDIYEGRTDIRAVSPNWFSDSNDYYTIECKRIDGKADLNKKYVVNGVARFVISPPLYPSLRKRNIMFGYVVKTVDIPKNIIQIEEFQTKLLDKISIGKFVLKSSLEPEHYVYSCQYESETESVELTHLFYNFADVVRS